MIDHITFGVSDFERSTSFYDRALRPLGTKRLFDDNSGPSKATGYGDVRPRFWIAEHDPINGKLHIALTAGSRDEVDVFHAEALAAGGADNGKPGYRPHTIRAIMALLYAIRMGTILKPYFTIHQNLNPAGYRRFCL